MTEKLPPDALIEAALLTQTEPLSEKTMRELCVPPLSPDKLIDVLAGLKARWHDRALQLTHTREGWRFQIAQAAFERLGSLQEQRAPRYSRAVMETLAIIAYQQPVTRGDIEGIRGVAVSQNVMQTLQDRGWIEIIGHRDSIGRPALWATTHAFLSDLQLESLEALPPLTELGELVLPDLTGPAGSGGAEDREDAAPDEAEQP
ncbi:MULTISPECIES: SMC-Scp complex subunit ScpB [Neisseria]|uniref:Transcriptional regulators family protein n=1 Tax=Neisseria musculi TaxID=1815583 RepID=A0A7H1M9E1_9NEIS|nr:MULTISPECIES: SMC-Scp complex subunit ScpB [Neisseria]MBF0804423.1 SMC-Scp complex subunit ScpB [Neisseria sp. 19428wB4_WF04]QNT58256.1 transcriptional regulators family protein [Neisseria musculi]TFU42805.1 SMC-Scp complex subunit ScpB [Neisseria sp. WF04]